MLCLIDGCEGDRFYSNGLCSAHYWRAKNRADLTKPIKRVKGKNELCAECNSQAPAAGRKYCRKCINLRYKKPCIDCSKLIQARSQRCNACWGKTRRAESHHNWTGGRIIDANGYILLTDEESLSFLGPHRKSRGYIHEHRKVMAEYLGRPLVENENVHHKNGNRQDNRLENLELWSTAQPAGQRVEDKVQYALEILALYGKDFKQP